MTSWLTSWPIPLHIALHAAGNPLLGQDVCLLTKKESDKDYKNDDLNNSINSLINVVCGVLQYGLLVCVLLWRLGTLSVVFLEVCGVYADRLLTYLQNQHSSRNFSTSMSHVSIQNKAAYHLYPHYRSPHENPVSCLRFWLQMNTIAMFQWRSYVTHYTLYYRCSKKNLRLQKKMRKYTPQRPPPKTAAR